MTDEQLYQLCHNKAKRMRPVLNCRIEEAEDLGTDAWMKVRRYGVERITDLEGFLHVVIRRLHQDNIKKTRNDAWSWEVNADQTPEQVQSISHALIQADAMIERVAVKAPHYGEVLATAAITDSMAEGAEILGLSLEAYKSKIARARRMVRELEKN